MTSKIRLPKLSNTDDFNDFLGWLRIISLYDDPNTLRQYVSQMPQDKQTLMYVLQVQLKTQILTKLQEA